MQWIVHDRYGNQIYLTEERWQHALEKRPWLDAYFDDALETIRRGRRQQDPLQPYKYKYYLPCEPLKPEFNHIVVVILFKESANADGKLVSNNYVTNVWAVYLYSQR